MAVLQPGCGRGSSVGVATCRGPDRLGIEFRLGRDFQHLPDLPRDPPSLLHSGYRLFCPGVQNAWGVALTTDPDQAPRLKKE